MLLTLLLLLVQPDSLVYSGRDRRLDVPIPRVEADVAIDGTLAESVWTRAAVLTGFSQYAPNDGVSASDSTQVLVWYSASAIYFGIRAFELHGRPTMTGERLHRRRRGGTRAAGPESRLRLSVAGPHHRLGL